MNLRSIRVRPLAMSGLLTVGFAACRLDALASDYRAMRESSRILAVSELAVATGDLVHELHQERGLSAGFIASQGGKFAAPLLARRKLTDERARALQKIQAERAERLLSEMVPSTRKTSDLVQEIASASQEQQTMTFLRLA